MARGLRPSGNVTFVFTDVEGSSRLWELDPDGMREAMKLHDSLLRTAFESEGGYIFKTVGDAFCVAFDDPVAAVEAAIRVQEALHKASWPTTRKVPDREAIELKVRAAILTGHAELSNGDYFGQPLNRVARLMGIAYAGQVLATEEVCAAAETCEDWSWGELGDHRLRDLLKPIKVFQLFAPGLAKDFPPLKSLSLLKNNLPEQLTSFVGREAELDMGRELLRSNRLLTLLGAGGVGKTRLALQLAAQQADAFPDGVWFVELAALTDPNLVSAAIADALGAKYRSHELAPQAVSACLGDKTGLLVIDNCEHLISAVASVLDQILKVAPNCKVLATSREPLGITGEQRFRVPSLGLPNPDDDPRAALNTESLRLFRERAMLVRPGMVFDDDSVAAMAEVCRRLDGIPLAVELAVARLGSLELGDIAQRLDRRFQLLTQGSRTALPRQRTLRALLEWSYDLLNEREQILFRRLAVFQGGWTLKASEAVASGDGIEADELLDLMDSLVAKSLVHFDEDRRYSFPETVRQFALERLEAACELEWLQRNMLGFLEAQGRDWRGRMHTDIAKAHAEIHAELPNILASIEFAGRSGETANAGLGLIGGIIRYWQLRGHAEFALERFNYLLAASPKDTESLALAYGSMGILYFSAGENEKSREACLKSIRAYEEIGDRNRMMNGMSNLATVCVNTDRFEEAHERASEVHRLSLQEGFEEYVAPSLLVLGLVAHRRADYEKAMEYAGQARQVWIERSNDHGIGVATNNMAHASRRLRNFDQAAELYGQALAIRLEIGDHSGILQGAEGLAKLALAKGDIANAIRMAAAVEALRTKEGHPRLRIDLDEWQEALSAMQAAPGFAELWDEGEALSEDQLVTLLRQQTAQPTKR